MGSINNLKDLLIHELKDLTSVEEQIIEALPDMIEKAGRSELKKALKDHLTITKKQRTRIMQARELLEESSGQDAPTASGNGEQKAAYCEAMAGLISEGTRMMAADMPPEVMDAVIIACAQKIEHYEIAGYGTARAWASELGLREIESMLEQTKEEECQSDELLTLLAVGRINMDAEEAAGDRRSGRNRKSAGQKPKADSRSRAI